MSIYRLILKMPVFVKVFETVLFQQLYDYYELHSLLEPAQYGFTKLRYTVSVVDWSHTKCFWEQKSSFFFLCDLSRAFDTVQRDILIMKIHIV